MGPFGIALKFVAKKFGKMTLDEKVQELALGSRFSISYLRSVAYNHSSKEHLQEIQKYLSDAHKTANLRIYERNSLLALVRAKIGLMEDLEELREYAITVLKELSKEVLP